MGRKSCLSNDELSDELAEGQSSMGSSECDYICLASGHWWWLGSTPGQFCSTCLSILWMQEWNTSSASSQTMLMWEVIWVLQRDETLQRDLDTSEHREIINVMKFSEWKCWMLHLWWSNAGHRHSQGDQWLGSRSAEQDLEVLLGSRLNINQHHALAANLLVGVH